MCRFSLYIACYSACCLLLAKVELSPHEQMGIQWALSHGPVTAEMMNSRSFEWTRELWKLSITLLTAFNFYYSQILMLDLGNVFPWMWMVGHVGNIDELSEMHLGRLGYFPNSENLQECLSSAVCKTEDTLKKRKCLCVCVLCAGWWSICPNIHTTLCIWHSHSAGVWLDW